MYKFPDFINFIIKYLLQRSNLNKNGRIVFSQKQ